MAGFLLACPAPGAQGRAFHPCGPRIDCGRVTVPLDRAGRAPGALRLAAVRVRARSRHAPVPRDAVVALSGGPGESAIPYVSDIRSEVAPALRTRDLLVFDPRGTGYSAPVRCRRFESGRLGGLGKATGECAAGLGPAAFSYNTEEAARDIEAVRVAAGIRKLTVYGVSYGTKVALVYAALFPDRVERLVLDSVVDPLGPDPFDLDSFASVPRVMRQVCAARRCRGVTADPVADLSALVARLARGPLSGYVVGGDGRRRARGIGRGSLLDLLVEGDFDPAGRAAIPGAVRSALNGDPQPLLRLEHSVIGSQAPDPVRLFDVGTFVATSCADQGFPWSPDAPLNRRWPAVILAADAIPPAALVPFDRATVRSSSLLRTCALWPPTSAPAPSTPTGPLPDVPTLIFSGSADMRTPTEAARVLAARQPHSSLLVVPGAGHSVLPNDVTGCTDRAVRQFFSDQPVDPLCPRYARTLLRLLGPATAEPIAPRSLGHVAPPPGLPNRVGRTVRAAGLTFLDVLAQTVSSSFGGGSRVMRIGGLRAGRAVIREHPHQLIRLEGYSYVPGVRMSMRPTPLGANRVRLRVGGRDAASGTLRFDFRADSIHGRLGGRRIRLLLSRQLRRAVRRLYSSGLAAQHARRVASPGLRAFGRL